ncbi:MAG TPA: RHS repeat-associated core domain-containing protein, partial [Blastocatellia bacterium]|nr:RHS repeat-associated core domain-containing protein [Blastocatellia bacterium]
ALSSLNYGNGRRLTMGYNNDRSQPISMKVDRVTNSADKIIDYQYDYYTTDPQTGQNVNNNRIRKITDNIDPQYTTTYSYDAYNRLQSAQWSGDGRFYQHDEWGNIRSVNYGLTYNYAPSANGAPATNRLESVALNGVTQTTYSYDAAGNTVSGDGKTFAYDAVNRLKAVNGGTGTYGYDGDGKRVRVTDGSAAVYYVYSSKLGQSVMEVTSASVQRAYVYNNGKIVAMQATDGQFYWLHTNHMGNSRAMTDASGTLTYKGQFDPYGATLTEWSGSGNINLNSKKFTGYERDSATGLDYAQARMYNSARGRFMTPDPIGLKAANTKQPESLNRYAYVQNDPVNYVDSSGLYGGWVFCGMVSFASGEGWWMAEYQCGTYGFSSNINAPYISIMTGDLSWMTEQKKCPVNPEKLDKVIDYLDRSGIGELVDSKRIADNGAGFILQFKDDSSDALKAILQNKDYWAGGNFGGALHERELQEKFGVSNAYFSDYRSFNGGNTALGDQSMQVTLIYKDEARTQLLGAYTDTDKFNFRQDAVGAVGHAAEVVLHGMKKIFGKDCP